ncbi:NAD(P)-dependent alcohol dehydrogenase [Bradyrhizobium sp. NP1]|uniref:zinc-dependent alcohol dehydrogenase family protein n=1 Tax=Bradyrhizobium sp. NP1 TaxID=3049772 RepID=UPI0025A67BA0|nr:NAD(P)-dependent alcohol dehydrogenase [Bradyrhizobium sp. NP1]WJR75833.1 NAD(P)-dependent alcohol dehydrogenase [Bradyrhizobium sp. NP1]
MRVMELKSDWGLKNLTAGERRAPPLPGRREVLVEMQAASINFRDYVMVAGGYGRRGGKLPMVPVSDGAGRVVAVGQDVSTLAVNDIVCPNFAQTWIDGALQPDTWKGMLGGYCDGVLQETMLFPEHCVVRAASHLSAVEAATLPCAALTAWSALTTAGIKPGSTILTQGTGGVSLFALQFAKQFGAKVIITSSSDEKLKRARELGADETINYRTEPAWEKRAREIAGPSGIDLVMELAGTLTHSIKAVREEGTVAMIGVLDGPSATIPLGQVVTRAIRLQGVTAGPKRAFEQMMRAVDLHKLRPIYQISGRSLTDAPSAIAQIAKAKHFGKICLEFGSSL